MQQYPTRQHNFPQNLPPHQQQVFGQSGQYGEAHPQQSFTLQPNINMQPSFLPPKMQSQPGLYDPSFAPSVRHFSGKK
jgi:hypothetical protein